MKFCINCGKEIKDKVKFCPFCGAEQKEVTIVTEPVVEKVVNEEVNNEKEQPIVETKAPSEEVAQPEQPVEQPSQPTINQENQQSSQQQQPNNEQQAPLISINHGSVNQLTDNSKNYFSYLNKNIAKPNIGGQNTNGYFGLVSYVLISLFSSLAISHSIGKAVRFGTMGYADSSFPLLIQLFLLILVTQLISVTTVYVLSAKIFREEISFLDSFDRVYAPISLAVYTSLFAFVLSFVSTIGLSFLFVVVLLFTYFLTNASFVANLWVSQNQTQRNKFYWTIGVIIVSFIVQIIVGIMLGDIIGTSIAEIISNVTDSFTPRMFL
ncbi:zinc-ribbon domain-containing protein [Vagococcus carniphilus]|uniref:zinc-ribbon domain-containing protein n=1 Tax=Vagococcus carniphilus TaxID=218144 RepID=UPI003BAA96E7